MKPNAEPLNLYVSNLNECLLQFKLGSEEQRINTLKCVEMLAYAGGNSFEQHLLKDPTILNICVEGLREKGNSKPLQIHFAQTLAVFCQGGFASLEAIFRNDVMKRLVSCMGDKKGELLKSVLYAIYCLLVKNYERYKFCFKNELLTNAIDNTLSDDWNYWPFNVSERLNELMNMTSQAYQMPFPERENS